MNKRTGHRKGHLQRFVRQPEQVTEYSLLKEIMTSEKKHLGEFSRCFQDELAFCYPHPLFIWQFHKHGSNLCGEFDVSLASSIL